MMHGWGEEGTRRRTSATEAEPGVGIAYNIKPTNTVLRVWYAGTIATPCNEPRARERRLEQPCCERTPSRASEIPMPHESIASRLAK